VTTYAAELLEYVICNLGIASRNLTERKAKAEAYLDANIGMDRRDRTSVPTAGVCVITDDSKEN